MYGFKNVNIDITLMQNFSLRIPLVHSVIDPQKNCIFFFFGQMTHSTHLHKSLESRILFLARLDHFQGKGLVTAKGSSSMFQLFLPGSTELCQEHKEHNREYRILSLYKARQKDRQPQSFQYPSKYPQVIRSRNLHI